MMGTATGGGLHTLLFVIVGMLPPSPGDDPNLWATHLVYASSLPVFVIVMMGLVLAPMGPRVAPLGGGLVVGAVASPLLWLAIGT